MASKRSVSPGRIDLMKEIMKLIAEPSPVNSRKKTEANLVQHQDKVINNHDYCDVCSGGGEIVCCDKCPKSFHISCHVPSINKLPDGEWFCRGCVLVRNNEFSPEVPINDDVGLQAKIKKLLNLHTPDDVDQDLYLEEISTHRKYNVKLPARKQLDKLKMIRKNDRCTMCKRGILRGRLFQCNYCSRLYHLNCLDPPIRDWDHNMRWMCPAHNTFYETAYPELYPFDGVIRTDTTTIKRLRCEPTHETPKKEKSNIPKHIKFFYTPSNEEDIPLKSTENSSLNILCDIASIELKSINSNHMINIDENAFNGDSMKFLAHVCHESQKINSLVPKQPPASLSCITVPFNISIHKKSLTIGKSPNNNLCLLPYGNCEFISDYHATITFDDKNGDYFVRNHSRHGISVDDVSYFGRNRPKDLKNSNELKQINFQVRKHLNKRRRIVRKHSMFHFYENSGSENVIIKYAEKKQKFDYRPLYKYYMNTLIKNVKHSYPKIQCKCSNRSIPIDEFEGEAVLLNDSIMSIGCLKFKFTYTRKIPIERTEQLFIAKQDSTVENKPLNGIKKPQSKQENGIVVISGTENKPKLVTMNGHCSLEDLSSINSLNEQKYISTCNLDNSENRHGISNNSTIINATVDNLIIPFTNDKSSKDINLSYSPSDTSCKKKWINMNGMSGKLQSCFANDLVQEVEVNESSEEYTETIDEEIVYEMSYTEVDNSKAERISDVQDWIIEEIVVEEGKNFHRNSKGHSVNLQLASAVGYHVPDHNLGKYKTEHLYCARSPSTYKTSPINISDDDD